MQNAVDKTSSSLRTIISYIFGLTIVLFLHNTFFQLRTIDTNYNCISAISKPFIRPDVTQHQDESKNPKSNSLIK